MKDIKTQLQNTTKSPGVYIMKDIDDIFIYIGKAKNLKNRLSSYFRNTKNHDLKTKRLVETISSFEYIVTTTEEEAILLEANLIKKYRPKFNILLKDDKSYPYIAITKEKYPNLIKTRNPEKFDFKYGPFSSAQGVDILIDEIKELYPIRRCNINLNRVKRACVYYYLDYCIAPCVYDVKKEYYEYIEKIKELFKDDFKSLIERLIIKRDNYSDELKFEKAIEVREKIETIRNLKKHQNISNVKGEDSDYITTYIDENIAVINILIYREEALVDRENHVVELKLHSNNKEVIESFIFQYYRDSNFIPKNIYLLNEIDKYYALALTEIKEKKVFIKTPKRGKHLEIIRMSYNNAKEYALSFMQKIKKEVRLKQELDLRFKSLLSIDKIDRIEAYDISNIFGHLSVGSMVVYENYNKKPNDYRKFKIKEVTGIDDVGSLKEVIKRRIKRLGETKFGLRPDLIIVDGGKNQYNAVRELLEKDKIKHIGLVKDDSHNTRAIYYDGREISIYEDELIYSFLYKLQLEMHRYALDYHKKLRTKNMLHSVLDEIKGIGQKKKQSLLKHFSSLENIKNASIDELKEISIISQKDAINIKEFFKVKK